MKVVTKWNEGMKFTSESGPHQVVMDARSPIGKDGGFTPKELVVAGIAGCTGIDVVSLLKKYKEPLESLEISAEVNQTQGGYPVVFKDVTLLYSFTGKLNKDKVFEAVVLSQTKYCGVTAMIAETSPVQYEVTLNGEVIGAGKADFGGET